LLRGCAEFSLILKGRGVFIPQKCAQIRKIKIIKAVFMSEADRRRGKGRSHGREEVRKQELPARRESQRATYEIRVKNTDTLFKTKGRATSGNVSGCSMRSTSSFRPMKMMAAAEFLVEQLLNSRLPKPCNSTTLFNALHNLAHGGGRVTPHSGRAAHSLFSRHEK
jgi:hypothetical protein